jgi:hypothetical protein
MTLVVLKVVDGDRAGTAVIDCESLAHGDGAIIVTLTVEQFAALGAKYRHLKKAMREPLVVAGGGNWR